MAITVDDKEFRVNIAKFERGVKDRTKVAVHQVATEVLRLSQLEVPHDTGLLQGSGHLEPDAPAEDIIVGYNKVYAAKLHEHPEYNFQKGRKGKYLEDPIKHNISVFIGFFKKVIMGL